MQGENPIVMIQSTNKQKSSVRPDLQLEVIQTPKESATSRSSNDTTQTPLEKAKNAIMSTLKRPKAGYNAKRP
jgi:hypothetical protein